MTVEEIKRELDALGIDYKSDMVKAELEELLAAAEEAPSASLVAATGGKRLNLRAAPDGAVVTTVPDGTALEAAGKAEAGWRPVTLRVWAMEDFLR